MGNHFKAIWNILHQCIVTVCPTPVSHLLKYLHISKTVPPFFIIHSSFSSKFKEKQHIKK